jgi:hypothetical protein
MNRIGKAKVEFKAELEEAGLSQRALARLLAKDPGTVNRWCRSPGSAGSLVVPQYAAAFVAAFRLLPERARRDLSERFGAN